MESTSVKVSGINDLINAIQKANQFFLDQTQRQVNTSLTLRNWVIGYYIAEYEQNGMDRADYGSRLLEQLAYRIKKTGMKGLSFTILHLCKQFYRTYPQILQAVIEELQVNDNQTNRILQTVSEESLTVKPTPPNLLLNRLSFSHFIELIKADTPLKRIFYETETIKNNWSIRELQRAMNSMLFERTGLSRDKEAVLEKHREGSGLRPADVFRSPYLLDFLGLDEKVDYIETDLEQAIIENLQKFLLEWAGDFASRHDKNE
ncbi:MAG TPA: DUF1016 N-terminal domain-containing protein [Puia sp.]|jgi:predicted nuclease of restriction endonuclease-like (RecB) superfamily|nr:DUF1016 N-terminal domain-containing protein [Puia sp.]